MSTAHRVAAACFGGAQPQALAAVYTPRSVFGAQPGKPVARQAAASLTAWGSLSPCVYAAVTHVLGSALAAVSCRSEKVIVASAGMQADMKTLHKTLQARHVMYMHDHNKPMSITAAAQLLSNTLYYKRFFPYYTFNLVAGLDENGTCGCAIRASHKHTRTRTRACRVPWPCGYGCERSDNVGLYVRLCTGVGAVFSYDAIGSYERSGFFCQVRASAHTHTHAGAHTL